MDVFRHNRAFQEKSKKVFMNNFCVPELQISRFLTQKETMIIQIFAASPSPNFHSGKSYVKKIILFTFLAICANFQCKIQKFELEVLWVFQGQDFGFRAASNISYSEIAAKRVTLISFLSLISLRTVLLQSITTYILVEKVKLGTLDACVFKYIYKKETLG